MYNSEWEEVKEILESTPEPTLEEISSVMGREIGESHEFGKSRHMLKSFIYDFKIRGYETRFSWSICPECRKVWNKRMTVFNNKLNSCYTHQIVKGGKPVEKGLTL